ncbi:helix-turn-helix domain-containing protein [Nocardia cyriacigeorgica]|uniref:helix-turn-helix domain-containing protein n=1 Tax=Nocardia cyriacigeorgica TaxID=135487 RepID=UPI001895F0F4|nr:helix-turn-helix domain-containing protein [Nocardia cyriacigeorgica]MBF6162780.1 AraC family transcriptional regulator [Nocardia cyriacigeorgica]MBF6201714.1 AraC family transcriptional regulator [Nocardia cyriacigeorgica]MBF6347288.1 AraC family transcriptional regulator [Nocardia cyriacigeorgica]
MPERGDRGALAGRKGILHPDEQARYRTLRRLPVGPELAEVIDWYWSVRWDLRGRPPYIAEVLPFPCVNVTFERSETKTGGFVNGVCTTRFVRELTGAGETFGIRFRAGGFGAFTGLDVGEFRDRTVGLAEVLPDADRLAGAVLAESSDEGRRDVVETFFARGLSAPDPNYDLVLRIVEAMATDRDLTRVDQVTERYAVSIRTLQRLFRRYVGAGPKWVLRRYRLQDAADLLARGRVDDLAALSAELGYYDQAHFTREFTAEVGMAPAEYAKHTLRARNEVTAKMLPRDTEIPEQFR